MKKKAIITGITGQDGFYLAKLLLEKEYEVHGCLQPLAHNDTSFLEPFLNQLHLHYCDLCDGGAVFRLLAEVRPDEIYNLGAQTHVGISFEVPEYTTNVNGLGTLRLLEAMRALKLEKTTRFYQASTSEIFGDTPPPQNELSAFHPRSPYAAAKLYAYHIVQNYRDAYGIHASNGILFNHESPKRGHDFVTRKVTRAVAAISAGKQEYVELGNMNAMRDWGHAVDYVEGQWLMLQKDIPGDYVLATGRKKSVRDLCNEAFQCIGITLEWRDSGSNEIGVNKDTGKTHVMVNPKFFRPLDVENLHGNPEKALKLLGWSTKITFEEMIKEMVEEDIRCLN